MENDNNKPIWIPTSSEVPIHVKNSIAITEKILEESESVVKCQFSITWEFLFNFKPFLNQLFSTYYHFNEDDLNLYSGKLEIGSPFLTDGVYILENTKFGLIYNKNIVWTDSFKTKYYTPSELIRVTEHADIWSYETNFDELPLDLLAELSETEFLLIRNCDSYYNEAFEEIIEYYENLRSKSSFSKEDMFDIIQNNKLDYIFNKNFYYQLIAMIMIDIKDFSVNKFYDYI